MSALEYGENQGGQSTNLRDVSSFLEGWPIRSVDVLIYNDEGEILERREGISREEATEYELGETQEENFRHADQTKTWIHGNNGSANYVLRVYLESNRGI